MRFNHYVKDNLSDLEPFDTLPCDIIEHVYEGVIFVDSKSYIERIDKVNIKRFNMTCLNDVLSFLNSEFNIMDVYFKAVSSKTVMDAKTNLKSGVITIMISKELFYNKISSDYKWFLKKFKRILDHELIHRVQGQKINFNKIKPLHQDTNDIEKYLSNKQEIMSYAKNIIEDLLRKQGTPEKVLKLLQNPPLNINKDLKNYLLNFELGSKTMKKLYKYMYEYLITGGTK